MLHNKLLITLLAVGCFLTGNSCKKSNNPDSLPSGMVSVTLKDAPSGSFDSVGVDIQGIELCVSNIQIRPGFGWDSFPEVNSGSKLPVTCFDLSNQIWVYNPWALKESEIVIGSGNLPVGHYTFLSLIFGPNNYVVKNGIKYPLTLYPLDEATLKLNINAVVTKANTTIVKLEFDEAQSIVAQTDGSYMLNPVLKRSVMNE